MMDFLNQKKKYLIIGLVLFSFVAMAYSGRNNYQPGPLVRGVGFGIAYAQGFFMGIGDWISDRADFLINMNDIHAENARLQEQLWLYQIEIARLRHYGEENAMLSELLNVYNRYSGYPVLAANIIAQDPTNWFDTFTINRGASHGVLRDMAVLAPGGLAGRISQVGYNYAIVTTLIDDTSAVSAQSRRSGDWGLVRGDVNLTSHGLLIMEFIDIGADIAIGDEILTSSASSVFPPGIHIGYVVGVDVNIAGMREALIEPSVDFAQPAMVLVITELFTHELISLP